MTKKKRKARDGEPLRLPKGVLGDRDPLAVSRREAAFLRESRTEILRKQSEFSRERGREGRKVRQKAHVPAMVRAATAWNELTDNGRSDDRPSIKQIAKESDLSPRTVKNLTLAKIEAHAIALRK